MNVKDAMTSDVISVRPDTSLKDVAVILAENKIGGLPVVDDQGHVLGVISKADILAKERAETPYHGLKAVFHRREADEMQSKIDARIAEEAMMAPAVTVQPSWSIASAAELMIERGVNRLPVTEAGGKLAGIITRHDLVREFARSDAELEQEIRDETLRGLSWTEGLQLSVENGEVTLRGELESRYDAEALPSMIRRIPGVVGVDSELTGWDAENQRKVAVSEQL
jgi:CBS domain-containing protein